MLDVNAGIPLADEPRILAESIQLVQSITDVPISIDSSIIEALEAGLSVYQGKALVNSVTGEDEVLERGSIVSNCIVSIIFLLLRLFNSGCNFVFLL